VEKKLLSQNGVNSFNSDMLQIIISNTETRNHFLQFLESEFAVENLFFHEECLDFKRRVMGKLPEVDIVKLAADICDKYVSSSALHCVNLSFKTRQALLDDLKCVRIGSDTFEKARLEIFNLMARDSFLRFKRSKLYAGVLQETDLTQSQSEMTGISEVSQRA
jgi:hypothetical protein